VGRRRNIPAGAAGHSPDSEPNPIVGADWCFTWAGGGKIVGGLSGIKLDPGGRAGIPGPPSGGVWDSKLATPAGGGGGDFWRGLMISWFWGGRKRFYPALPEAII